MHSTSSAATIGTQGPARIVLGLAARAKWRHRPDSRTKWDARVDENTAADGIELSAEQIERLANLEPAAGGRHDEINMAIIDR